MKFKRTWRSKLNYKSVLDGIKNIKKRNDKFHSLSKKEQRMEIGLDVLDMLSLKQISGGDDYWNYQFRRKMSRLDDSKELQNKLMSKSLYKEENCEVCARGAMMLSTIRLGNNIDPDTDYISRGTPKIQKHFTRIMYVAMEAVYEDYCYKSSIVGANEEYEHPYEFNTSELLANIFLQVIQTDGGFSIKNNTDYLKLIISK